MHAHIFLSRSLAVYLYNNPDALLNENNFYSPVQFAFVSYKQFAQVGISIPEQKQPSTADKLALQYYEQKEFEKANAYFEDLYEKTHRVGFSIITRV